MPDQVVDEGEAHDGASRGGRHSQPGKALGKGCCGVGWEEPRGQTPVQEQHEVRSVPRLHPTNPLIWSMACLGLPVVLYIFPALVSSGLQVITVELSQGDWVRLHVLWSGCGPLGVQSTRRLALGLHSRHTCLPACEATG